MASEKCLEILESLVCYTVKDVKNPDEVAPVVKTSVCSKQDGYEDFLAGLITDACSELNNSSRKYFKAGAGVLTLWHTRTRGHFY